MDILFMKFSIYPFKEALKFCYLKVFPQNFLTQIYPKNESLYIFDIN